MRILSINSGSSSLKLALYSFEEKESVILLAQANRIGHPKSVFRVMDHKGDVVFEISHAISNHLEVINYFFDWANEQRLSFDGVGHRIVHGGPQSFNPSELTNSVIETLKEIAPFDPDHLPDEIQIIEAIKERMPTICQVACFDTAFHATLPDRAKYFAIPKKFWDQGIYRFGFHGLSYEFIMQHLKVCDKDLAEKGKLIIAHLGNGASMAAVFEGRCIDTTMGFTPLGGLIMSCRCGDLDPSVLLYLQKELGMSVEELSRVLNKESGLLGISDASSDMRDLQEIEKQNPQAELAIEMFCYQVVKTLGAYQAVLGGLDCIVFTGGIGENSEVVRKKVCQYFENVPVKVVNTNEELMIARHTYLFIKGEKNGSNN